MSDASDPRVVAVFVDLADLVGVGVLVVKLDVVLGTAEAIGDDCELGVVGSAVLAVELAWVPAAARDPTLLCGC